MLNVLATFVLVHIHNVNQQQSDRQMKNTARKLVKSVQCPIQKVRKMIKIILLCNSDDDLIHSGSFLFSVMLVARKKVEM